MLGFIRVGLSAILVTICSSVAVAAVEVALYKTFLASDSPLLEAARAVSNASVVQSSMARDKASALQASATSLRRVAYDLTNQPGLSAVQNRWMVVAMEAADTAESAAGVA